MKKLGNTFSKNNIGEKVELEKDIDKFAPRRIFPGDHEALRKLVFEKGTSYVDVLSEIHEFSECRIKEKGIMYYKSFERYITPSAKHKSVGLPQEFNDFLNKVSTKDFPAKHLLSAMIQDFILSKKNLN